jgi:riboflavin biosynthesis pyrimidine reductase
VTQWDGDVVPAASDAPEQRARRRIDAALVASGWVIQDRDDMNVRAGRGVAVRELELTSGHFAVCTSTGLQIEPASSLLARIKGEQPIAAARPQRKRGAL